MRIGIDVGGTKIESIALSDQGEELFRKRVPTPRERYEDIVNAIHQLVVETEATVGQSGSVGVGIPGAISKQTRLVKNANTQCLIGHPLEDDLSKILERPVRCSNDANCLAVSEAIDGAAAGQKFVLGIIMGTGCGGGLALNGQAHDGRNLVAGEIGHVTLPWISSEELAEADDCYCGFKGCNETWISGTGFARDYKRQTGIFKKSEEIVALAHDGDPAALENLARFEDRLARVIAHMVNIMDPDTVVLGGGMSNVARLYENVPPMLPKYVFGSECDTPVVQAKHGDS
ncbi:MAG: ROK family protein, partial [Pseudomonadota bacterium]